ncbi:MAG: recombinase family protein [Defluviitaleaceae bacterium]|nr:recombinase family protein [Defluviitaleaceae bacterium]
MSQKKYALIRISTQEQNEQRQVIKMLKIGIPKENIIVEKESGKSTERLKYHKLVNRLKMGDILYIENIDRLSRDYDGIVNEWQNLKQKGVIVKILDTPILDTDQKNNSLLDRFICNILLHILAFQAEAEWIKIKERQAQGIAVAKSSGKNLGRPKATITNEEKTTISQYQNGEITLKEALSQLKIKKSAFYKLRGFLIN